MTADARREVTVEDLERWVEHGATWRTLELNEERAVVQMCTCYGEPVDLLVSGEPEVIEFVRTHPQSA
jgi:hypothetical protein